MWLCDTRAYIKLYCRGQIIASDSLNLPTTSDYEEAQHPLYQRATGPWVPVETKQGRHYCSQCSEWASGEKGSLAETGECLIKFWKGLEVHLHQMTLQLKRGIRLIKRASSLEKHRTSTCERRLPV